MISGIVLILVLGPLIISFFGAIPGIIEDIVSTKHFFDRLQDK